MRVPGVPWDPARTTHGGQNVVGGVVHRTYGRWPGDFSVGKRNPGGIGFHFLIGKDEGRWVQFADTTRKCWHAAGGNTGTVGIEFEGRNEEPLTNWQIRAGAWIIAAVSREHDIEKVLHNEGRRNVRGGGWTAHGSVSGSNHTDTITDADWGRMAALWSGQEETPQTPVGAEDIDWVAVRRLSAAHILARGIGDQPELFEGHRSIRVVLFQQALNLLTGERIMEDGVFGPQTRDLVVRFQKWLGLPQHGRIDDLTRFWIVISLQNIRDGKA